MVNIELGDGGYFMQIGYIRISSKDQNEDRQIDALHQAGIEPVHTYIDRQSGKDFNRDQYRAMLKALRPGDVLVVNSLDRFGRNYAEIRKEFANITERGIVIHVLDMPILNTDQVVNGGITMQFISDLVLSVLGYVAEKELANIRIRQKDGISAAKHRGVRFGRPDKDAQVKKAIKLLDADPDMTVVKACRIYGVTRSTFYNYKQSANTTLSM